MFLPPLIPESRSICDSLDSSLYSRIPVKNLVNENDRHFEEAIRGRDDLRLTCHIKDNIGILKKVPSRLFTAA
jgi:hypothetical protein